MPWISQATNLPLIDVPPRYAATTAFGTSLQGKAMHWFGLVNKVNKDWKTQPRYLMISPSHLYFFDDSSATRCLPIDEIQALVVDPRKPLHLAFKVRSEKEHDLCFVVESEQDRTVILTILATILGSMGQKLQEMSVPPGQPLQNFLKLQRPEGWKLQVEKFVRRDQVGVETGSRAEPYPPSPAAQQNPLVDEAIREFENLKSGLKEELMTDYAEQYNRWGEEREMYVEMLEDREREIDRLRRLTNNIHDDPNIWKSCPNCRARDLEEGAETKPQAMQIHALERQLEDCEHLIDHLHLSRANAAKQNPHEAVFSESTQILRLKQEVAETNAKIAELRRIIIESPTSYPTPEARKDALTRASLGPAPLGSDERERRLAQNARDLDRLLAEKDRELRHTRSVMREAFKREVEELDNLKAKFERYDQEIVKYLEQVFAGKTFPVGASYGQSPRELAEITAEAAQKAAMQADTSFPKASSATQPPSQSQPDIGGRAWLGSHLQPLSHRLGSASRQSIL